MSKQEFRRLLIHLYAKDEDLSVARSVVNTRIEELMDTIRCATERLSHITVIILDGSGVVLGNVFSN